MGPILGFCAFLGIFVHLYIGPSLATELAKNKRRKFSGHQKWQHFCALRSIGTLGLIHLPYIFAKTAPKMVHGKKFLCCRPQIQNNGPKQLGVQPIQSYKGGGTQQYCFHLPVLLLFFCIIFPICLLPGWKNGWPGQTGSQGLDLRPQSANLCVFWKCHANARDFVA